MAELEFNRGYEPLTEQQENLGLTDSEKYEFVFDRIAEALIESPLINTTSVETNQKFIRDGQLQLGQGTGVLALYQKEIKANPKDGGENFELPDGTTTNELKVLIDGINNLNSVTVNVSGTVENIVISLLGEGVPNGGIDITPLVFGSEYGDFNPLNVSQFIPLSKQKSNVNIEQAEEFLDTNIFELLPTGDTRQSRIIRLFQELNALLPSELPNFDTNNDGRVDRDSSGNWNNAEQYSQDNSISYAQDNPQQSNIDEEDAFIHRLKDTANDTNSSRTIEDIYNTILPYLTDILEDPISPEDGRPDYQNQSSGYLKFRNPNQGIIIRNTNQEFVEGLDPNNPTYLSTGFTITMWVRFLDKVSEGTLFNFGNPLSSVDDKFGFRLETYTINKEDLCPHSDYETWNDAANDNDYAQSFFSSENSARFVRLIVQDNEDGGEQDGILRDSHIGSIPISNPGDETIFGKLQGQIPLVDDSSNNTSRLLNSTFIPMDFQEWYFICASFNPNIDEDNSFIDGMIGNSMYWMNNVNPDFPDNFIANSGLGNRCKVEIISRTDLLKSKGFNI